MVQDNNIKCGMYKDEESDKYYLQMKLWIYEIHIFELRNEELNVKKILADINATYAVAKRKPEKIRLAGIFFCSFRNCISCVKTARIFFTFKYYLH